MTVISNRNRYAPRHAKRRAVMPRIIILAILATAIVLAVMLGTGLLSVHGWDWSVGTNTRYCGVYLPHLDFYCEHAN